MCESLSPIGEGERSGSPPPPLSRPGATFWRNAARLQGKSINHPTNPSFELGPHEFLEIAPVKAPGPGQVYYADMRGAYLWALRYVRVDGKRAFRRTARWLCEAREKTEPGSTTRQFIRDIYCQGIGQMANRGYGDAQADIINLVQGRLAWAGRLVEETGGKVLAIGRTDMIYFWMPPGVNSPLFIVDKPGAWRVREEPWDIYNDGMNGYTKEWEAEEAGATTRMRDLDPDKPWR